MSRLCKSCIHNEVCRHKDSTVDGCIFHQKPRPKGRWERDICTNCGKDVYEGLDADIWSAYIPPFCPNCGANMREIENE